MVVSEVSPIQTGSPVPDVSSLHDSDNCVVTCSLHLDLREARIRVKRENAYVEDHYLYRFNIKNKAYVPGRIFYNSEITGTVLVT
jgi:hypothetical protein